MHPFQKSVRFRRLKPLTVKDDHENNFKNLHYVDTLAINYR